jgi:adenylate cyclase
MADLAETPLLIVFTDFSRYTAMVERLPDLEVARVMEEWYELEGSAIAAAGGKVVKFIGDAALAVFPPEHIDRGILGLLDLKDTADRFMADQGWECRLSIRAHFGSVVAGHFGRGQERHYDVLGKVVNNTARLKGSGVVLSVEAWARLGPSVAGRFRQDTPQTYARMEESR